MKSSFLVIADRGNLKAFRVEKVTAGRPLRLHLVQSLSLTDAHTKISEKNTDLAGRFPVGGGPSSGRGGGMRHQNSTSEKHYEIESDKRSAKHLAAEITTILRAEQPTAWSFAAPADINHAILDELDPALRKSLGENLPLDLVHSDPGELLERFTLRGVEAA